MSGYEELVGRCYDSTQAERDDVHTILGEVFRTLETVTPEMRLALYRSPMNDLWINMLRASPLAPPK